MVNWKKITVAVLALILTTGCTGSHVTRGQLDPAQPRTVFIEPFPGDYLDLQPRLAFKLASLGFEPVKDRAKASLTVIWHYNDSALSTNANVRLVGQDGNTLYLGEGNNPGFGTVLNRTGAVWGCLERALEGLEK